MYALTKDRLRMAQWLFFSLLAYMTAAALAQAVSYGPDGLLPKVQTILWKCGHLNLAAYLGYRIDRSAFRDRLFPGRDTIDMARMLRRALIMSATMIAFGLAL